MYVKPKKHLGQHFLVNPQIAEEIASIIKPSDCDVLIEIGPGTGVLTKFLFDNWSDRLLCYEVDGQSIKYLIQQEWALGLNLREQDFLQANLIYVKSDYKNDKLPFYHLILTLLHLTIH